MNWLKYFFLSFFKDEYAEEAHKRSLLNSFLSLLLAISIMCGMLFWGYCASMPHHYEEDENYRNKIYSILADDDKQFNIENGKFLLLDNNKDPFIMNETCDEITIITDTRDIENAFVNFTVSYIHKDGSSISYEDYLMLDDSKKSDYTFSVEYTNELINFDASQIAEYEDYLMSQPNGDIKAQYSELKSRESTIDELEYATGLYGLFVRSYYPDEVQALDMYAFAPTLRTYYDDIIAKTDTEFFLLYQDLLYTRFHNEDAVYIITGHAESMNNMRVSSRNDLDSLIFAAFNTSKTYFLIEYIFNFVRLIPTIIIGELFLSLILHIYFVISKNEKMRAYITSFKMINLYTIVSSILGGAVGFILSRDMSRFATYRISILVFAAVLTIRIALYIILKLFKKETSNESKDLG